MEGEEEVTHRGQTVKLGDKGKEENEERGKREKKKISAECGRNEGNSARIGRIRKRKDIQSRTR